MAPSEGPGGDPAAEEGPIGVTRSSRSGPTTTRDFGDRPAAATRAGECDADGVEEEEGVVARRGYYPNPAPRRSTPAAGGGGGRCEAPRCGCYGDTPPRRPRPFGEGTSAAGAEEAVLTCWCYRDTPPRRLVGANSTRLGHKGGVPRCIPTLVRPGSDQRDSYSYDGTSEPHAPTADLHANVQLSSVKSTDPDGRIPKADIEDYSASVAKGGKCESVAASGLDCTDIPNTQIRTVTANCLLASTQTVPHYYLTVDTRVDKLIKLRGELNPLQEASGGKKISKDLVIKDADKKRLGTLCEEVKQLAQRARDKSLKPQDYEGGTFTQSNLGGPFGIRQFPAILNLPQSAILAIGSGGHDDENVMIPTQGLGTIGEEVKQLAQRARDNKLKPQDYEGFGPSDKSILDAVDPSELSEFVDGSFVCSDRGGPPRCKKMTRKHHYLVKMNFYLKSGSMRDVKLFDGEGSNSSLRFEELKNKCGEMRVEVSRGGGPTDGFEESVSRCGIRDPKLVWRCPMPRVQMGAAASCIPVAGRGGGGGRSHRDTYAYDGTSRAPHAVPSIADPCAKDPETRNARVNIRSDKETDRDAEKKRLGTVGEEVKQLAQRARDNTQAKNSTSTSASTNRSANNTIQILVNFHGSTFLVLENLSMLSANMLIEHVCRRAGVRPTDLYSTFCGKLLEPNQVLSYYQLQRDSTVYINPRLRGGSADRKNWDTVIINLDRCHSVALSQDLLMPFQTKKYPAVKVWYLGHLLQVWCRKVLIYLCRNHYSGISFGGFTSKQILFDAQGNVHIDAAPQEYSQELAFLDYSAVSGVFDDALDGLDEHPTYFYHLINFLSKDGPPVDCRSKAVIAFVTNHVSLLTHSQRIQISGYLDLLLRRLNEDDSEALIDILENFCWGIKLKKVPAMYHTYFFHWWYDTDGNVCTPYKDDGVSLLSFSNNFFKHHTRIPPVQRDAAFALATKHKNYLPQLLFSILVTFKDSKNPCPASVQAFIDDVIEMLGDHTVDCEIVQAN